MNPRPIVNQKYVNLHDWTTVTLITISENGGTVTLQRHDHLKTTFTINTGSFRWSYAKY